MRREVIIGNALDVLKEMPDESVDVVVTSPPYWALRDYGSEPVLWGGNPDCEHEWEEHRESARGGVGKNANVGANRDGAANNRGHPTITQYCTKCGAWRGQLGLEPTFQEYIDHLLMIFDEVYRVLKPTGACFVNISDTYGGSKKGNTETNKNNKVVTDSFVKKAPKDVPHKSLCLIPQRFAIGMVEHGWVCRNQINWCLEENTRILCKMDGIFSNCSIKELYDAYHSGKTIEVPSRNGYGDLIWVPVINVFDRGMQDAIKIKLNGSRRVVCSKNHEFPSGVGGSTDPRKYLKVHCKKASELTTSDRLFVNYGLFDGGISTDSETYNQGWAVGFFVAEGSLMPNNHDPKPYGLYYSCGVKDIERGYLDQLKKAFDIAYTVKDNACFVRTYSKDARELILRYVSDFGAHTIHPTMDAFERGPEFIKGIIDGFLAGDGYYDAERDDWEVHTCINYALMHWLEVASNFVGYEMHLQGYDGYYCAKRCLSDKVRSPNGSRDLEILRYSIRKNPKHTFHNGFKMTKIRSIENYGLRHMYDIEVESMYSSRRQKSNVSTNNLYFLGNGIWTHNCKPNVMPQSCTDRFTVDSEPMFFFTKESSGYYFNQLKEPVAESSKKRAEYGWKSTKANVAPGVEGGVEVDKMGTRFVPEDGRNMRTTWNINTSASTIEHCAMFPKALIERPIKACCPPGGVVLDPFCGSGTTLEYCYENGIDCIGIEINPAFKRIIEQRMRKDQMSLGDFDGQ